MQHKRWAWMAVVLVLAAAAGGYTWWRAQGGAATVVADTGDTLRTSVARRGNLEIMTTAAGTVVASVERTLGFDTPSELLALYVAVGQQVAAGDPLAGVDDLALRHSVAGAEASLTRAEIALQTARDSHAELVGEGDQAALLTAEANLASAHEKLADLRSRPTGADLAIAEAAVAVARSASQALSEGPTADELQEAQWSLERSRNSLWSAQMSRDAAAQGRSYDQAQVGVLNAEIAVAQAEMSLRKLQEPATELSLAQARASLLKAEQELATVRQGASAAELASAQAGVIVAQEALDALQEGATPTLLAQSEVQVRQAELDLEQARLNLESARRDLENATLTAPMAGTVMAIAAQVGENAGATLITLADLTRPVLEVFIDETDMNTMKVGYDAQVEFDALPGEIYRGEVVSVDPGLTTSGGMRVMRGLVALATDAIPEGVTLPTGMSATVDIIAGSAENAVLVPVEALRELDQNQYAVFVVTDGEPTLRAVEVGIIDVTYAEIVSGLAAGDVVTTGLVEVQ